MLQYFIMDSFSGAVFVSRDALVIYTNGLTTVRRLFHVRLKMRNTFAHHKFDFFCSA
jgi:hypothetical protein